MILVGIWRLKPSSFIQLIVPEIGIFVTRTHLESEVTKILAIRSYHRRVLAIRSYHNHLVEGFQFSVQQHATSGDDAAEHVLQSTEVYWCIHRAV
jgi:hypothetical protein